jgi:hypothetical protein
MKLLQLLAVVLLISVAVTKVIEVDVKPIHDTEEKRMNWF